MVGSDAYTEATRTNRRGVFPAGPLVAVLGGALALVGFLLPWIDFGSVVPAGSPSLSGYEVPGFLRASSFLVRVLAGRDFGTSSPLVNLIWLVPAGAVLAIALAVLSAAVTRARRAVGVLHLLLGLVVLVGAGYLFWTLSQLATAGTRGLLELVGYGLWATLAGMLLLLVGGGLELLGR